MYSQIVEGHLSNGFEEEVGFVSICSFGSTLILKGWTWSPVVLQVVRLGPRLVDAMIELHGLAMNGFLPSAGCRQMHMPVFELVSHFIF